MQAPPHSLEPMLHWKPQPPFTHVAVALATVGHAAQLVAPHAFTLVFERHKPPQSCVPMGHVPMHDMPSSMQTLEQIFWPMGQVAPHFVPSQVEEPPSGAEQAEQDEPHEAVA